MKIKDIILVNLVCMGLTLIYVGWYYGDSHAATVQPMREKTAARMTLESDGRWSIPGGLPILRGSEKIYRKGSRQTAGEDYILDPLNPHYIRVRGDILFPYKVVNDLVIVMEVWQKEDVVVMDYLY